MASKGQRVVDIAEGELGTGESPSGSNRGPCEKYQRVYGSWAMYAPWCGSFCGWAYETAEPGDGKQYSDPSTATICSAKPAVAIQPGCQLVDCGTHVTMARYSLGGGAWACVGGNEGNQVSFSTRDLSGWTLRGPPWLDDGAEPDEPPEVTWYGLSDPGAVERAGQRSWYGGWSSKASRDAAYTSLKAELGHEIRKFKDPDFDGCYLLDNSAYVVEVYGLWSSKASRDSSRATLEDRLGRDLRPFSETRTAAQGGVPWNCANA